MLLLIIFVVLGLGYYSSQAVTQTIVLNTRGNLEEHWRWQYDLLVYPEESGEYLDLKDGLVAPQTSIASYGGISFDDLDAIREIPGVELAAPLSLIGYFDYDRLSVQYGEGAKGEIYEIRKRRIAFDGLQEIKLEDKTSYWEFIDPNKEERFTLIGEEMFSYLRSKVSPSVQMRYPNQMMLVAIDPESENALYGLSDAITQGEDVTSFSISYELGAPVIPVIALADQGLVVNETFDVARVNVPEVIAPLDISNGILPYLSKLKRTPLAQLLIQPYESSWRYRNAKITLTEDEVAESAYLVGNQPRELYRYSPIHFSLLMGEENRIPLLRAEGKIKPQNPFLGEQDKIFSYRDVIPVKNQIEDFGVNIVGYYDTNLIQPQFSSNWKAGDPIDLYTPQHSMIIKDGAGNSVEPRSLIPLPMKDSYYTGAPDALTTMEVAKLFYKDAPPISSIRVVVSGIEKRSDESQKKIEQVAKEIMDRTGHRVEIMLGSASSKVEIELAGKNEGEVGVVEEGWQQKEVSWEIEEKVLVANQWLFLYMLVIIFILSYTVITHTLLKRSSEFAMLRSIGWTRKRLISGLAIEVILLSIVPLFILLVISGYLIYVFSWMNIVLLGLINFTIIFLGYLSGSRKAVWSSIQAGLAGEGSQLGSKRLFPVEGRIGFMMNQLLRRPLRFGLLLLSLILSTMMLLLFVATQHSLSDFLFLSFLGEIIDLHLQPYQIAFLIIGETITIIVIFLLITLNLLDRKNEFFILNAIGWSIRRIRSYIYMETAFIGMLGGLLGTIIAYILLTFFSELWLPSWAALLFILLPALLLILFSWIVFTFLRISRLT